MNYIVLDLEWNQFTHTACEGKDDNSRNNQSNQSSQNNQNHQNNQKNQSNQNNRNSQNKSSESMPFEIIEIGAVKLDENLKKTDTFNSLIRPVLYKKINPIISEITGIKEKELSKAKTFPDVIRNFIEWCGEDYIICTFGNQDIHELEINMKYHQCEIPWKYPLQYIDVQRIFGIENNEINEQRSLETVSIYMGVEQKNVYHRALSDAIYTAEVMQKMNQNNFQIYKSLDYVNLPENKKDEKDIDLGTHLEYMTRGFDSKDKVINYKDLYITRCPFCMKKCRKKIRWFSDGTKYTCVARCENHEYMEGIIYIRKNYNGYFGIRKTISINENRYQEIALRKDSIREKRRIKRHKK